MKQITIKIVILKFMALCGTLSAGSLNLTTTPNHETINGDRYTFVKKDEQVEFSANPSETLNSLEWKFQNGSPDNKQGNGPHSITYGNSALGKVNTVKFTSERVDQDNNTCTTTDKTTCKVIVPEYEITINTFIPANNIDHPIHPNRVFSGDDRSYNKNASSSRSHYKLTVIPIETLESNGIKSGSETKTVGKTTSYEKSTSLDSSGKLTSAAKSDTIKGTPLMVDYDTASSSGISSASSTKKSSRKFEYHCVVSIGNPLVLSPNIDYDFKITVDLSDPEKPKYEIVGDHDGYPGYEVYIGDKRIHEFDPGTTNSPWSLWGDSDQTVDKNGDI